LDYQSYSEEWRDIFQVESSEKAYELDVLVSGFGAAPVKTEGTSTAYDDAAEVWTARYDHQTISLQFAITEEAIEDNLYMSMGAKYAKALARSMIHTKEIKAAAILNNAFSTSYPGGDGAALLSRSHPLYGGGNMYNTLSTQADLSESSLEDLLVTIRHCVDDRGIPVAINPKLLIVPPELEYIASRILGSANRPGTSDNDINVINKRGIFGAYPHVVTRLTNPEAFFIKTDCMDGFKYFDRMGLKKRVDIEHDTGNYKYLVRERYSLGWTDPRACFGSY
jgi:hypothetical protein